MKQLFALVFFALLPSLSSASDWAQIDETIYVDRDSIVKDGRFTKAWIRVDYADEQKGDEATNFKPYDSITYFTRFDCRHRSSADKKAVYYDSEGNVVSSIALPHPAQFEEVVPDSIGEKELKYVCSSKAHK